MDRIELTDSSDRHSIERDQFDGAGSVDSQDDGLEIVLPENSPYSPTDVTVREGDVTAARGAIGESPDTLLLVPALLGTIALGIDKLGLLAGFPDIGPALKLGAYWIFALFAIVGTLYIFEDANALAESDASWQPDPWHFTIIGGLVNASVLLAMMGFPVTDLQLLVGGAMGAFIMGSGLASAVVGPVYFLLRRRAGVQ